MLNGSQKQVIELVFLADVGNLVCSGDHCVQTDPAKKCLDSCISNSGTKPDCKKARRR